MKAPRIDKYRQVLEKIPFFACLRADDLTSIEHFILERDVKKNDIILWEEDTSKYMYIVFSGKIKVVQLSQDGKEQIVAIHRKGDFFGEMSLLDGKTLPAVVIAMENSTVGLISKKDFESFFLNNENVLRQIISLLCERLRESWLMLQVLGFTDAEQRVRAVLTHISSLYGVKDLRGTIIPFKLTHKDIANYTALARETVSRLLSRLCQAGDIEILDNKNIVLKPSFARKQTATLSH